MEKLVRKHVLGVKPYVPGKPIEEVQRELGLRDVIKMASNENALGTSAKALRAIRARLGEINRYPDSSCFYLKKALVRHLARKNVREENLIIGNGSDEIITLSAKVFIHEADEVVIATPTFLIYDIAAHVAGAVKKLVPLKDFRYDLVAMNKAFTPKTKMVFIANPDNPTGTYVTRRELERFLDDTPKEVIVFLDEAYFEFAKDLPDYPNGMDYLDRPNIIVTRTFSKAYGLSGLRLGYGISNAQCVGYLDRVREPFNVNILAQYAGCAALEDRAFIRKTLKGIKREKEFLYSALKDLKTRYIPSATNFILIDLGQRDSKTIFHRMLKKGVIVREMSVWGFDTFIRVTIGTRPQNRRFIRALKEILED